MHIITGHSSPIDECILKIDEEHVKYLVPHHLPLDVSRRPALHGAMHHAPSVQFGTLTLSPALDRSIQLQGPISLDSIHQVESEVSVPGGKGFNAARVLAASNCPVSAHGLIGHDSLDEFTNACTELGITPQFIGVDPPTRENTMFTDGRHELKVNRPAFPELGFSPIWLDTWCAQLRTMGTTHLIASGSLPKLFPKDLYATLVNRLRAIDIRTAIDTSGEALTHALAATPWVIKPNRAEAEQLLGMPLTDRTACEQATRQLATRARYAILSDGPGGAWFATGKQLWHVSAPDVSAIDTTGAGDTLLAQFCSSLATDGFTPKAMARSVAAGAAATEHHGSTPPPTSRIQQLSTNINPTQIKEPHQGQP